jgi:ATP-binding cassette, subfamily G (WHITE), member 2, SNQ2
MGYGKGSAGSNGNGFQLMMVIFMELFGITLGQTVAALAPTVQVSKDHHPFALRC